MTNTKTSMQPYIIGRPIYEEENFFGREDLFQFIEDSLQSDTKFLLLHGQRRIGKSSVLQQLTHKVAQDKFAFVYFDLQGHSESSLGDILYKLAEEIVQNLELDSDNILTDEQELKNNSDIFSRDFLPQVYQQLDNKNLVLLLDEFDVVSSENGILVKGENFFRYLKSLLKKQEKLFIIPVVGRTKDDFHNLSQLFNSPPYQEIGLLNKISARRLITRPAKNILKYDEDAIEAIFKLSAGHPYFTQAICFNLFLQAKIKDNWTVTSDDIRGIVDKTIESATGGLTWFCDGLSISEKVVFSAVAETQKIAIEQNQSFPEDPLTLLKKHGVIPTYSLTQAAEQLAEKGYLDDTKRRVKIELVRLWLVKFHPLNQEIFQLDNIEKEEINNICQKEIELYRRGNPQDRIDLIEHYEEILQINPNHFSILPVLAQKYLEIENFEKALELYQRAYQLDSTRNQEGLLVARETYGKKLREQGELIKAKVQLEGVLEIELERELAKQELREIEIELEIQQPKQEVIEIETELQRQQTKQEVIEIETVIQRQQPIPEIEEKDVVTTRRNYLKKPTSQQVIWGGAIAAVIALVCGSIYIYQFSISRSQQQHQTKIKNSVPNTTNIPIPKSTSIPNNLESQISRGDRTLFFSISNSDRDQGIKAFKEGNYSQAIELFQNAINYNRQDPEVRIYYNNAKARQKGNFLTLAVVVPADNGQDMAQEVLRGVAQAQDQFNLNGGFNGLLLEIVIANDGDDPDQAKQIAQKLGNDQSVLGVIGHNISKTTEAALDVYKQANIPIISSTSTAKNLSGDNFFRTVPSDTASGQRLAEYAKNSRLKKVVIVYNSRDPYSNSLSNAFINNFLGQIRRQIDLTNPRLNLEQELKDIASEQVQAIMLLTDVGYTSTAIDIAKINANNQLGLKLLGGDSLYQRKLLNGGNAVEGLILAVPWFREATQSQKFANSANKYWGAKISWRTATSFDATQAFIKALSFKPSRKTILQGLRDIKISPEETSGNELKFIDGEPQNKAFLVEVQQGDFKQCLQPVCSF